MKSKNKSILGKGDITCKGPIGIKSFEKENDQCSYKIKSKQKIGMRCS